MAAGTPAYRDPAEVSQFVDLWLLLSNMQLTAQPDAIAWKLTANAASRPTQHTVFNFWALMLIMTECASGRQRRKENAKCFAGSFFKTECGRRIAS
jgi:hypothetical protein